MTGKVLCCKHLHEHLQKEQIAYVWKNDVCPNYIDNGNKNVR